MNDSSDTFPDNPRVAVILPAYNEEQTIAETIREFNHELPAATIWVINNRSSDATEETAKNTILSLRCAGGVINESRPGKGNAIRRAFIEIDADIYILADADTTYPASSVAQMMKPILDKQSDMVVGDRHSNGNYKRENKRQFHSFGNLIVRFMVNALFKASLADIMSGYRVFNRKFVKLYPITVEGFEIETDMTLHALDKRFRILEIPVNYKDRPEGSFSKLNTVSDGIRVVSTIFNILRFYRPLIFFGGLAIIFSLAGLIAGLPVILEYIDTHYINHIPLAILATGLEVTSIIFIAIGLILDSMVNQERRNFERDLLNFQ
jgi:glycosyltransferase involved in cell wall biosynthesis